MVAILDRGKPIVPSGNGLRELCVRTPFLVYAAADHRGDKIVPMPVNRTLRHTRGIAREVFVGPFFVVNVPEFLQLNRTVETACSVIGRSEYGDDRVADNARTHTSKLSGKGHFLASR